MKKNLRLYILTFLIILAVALPPSACYVWIASSKKHSAGQNIQDTRSGTESSGYDDENIESTEMQNKADSFVILLDPGHGGYDPGKVSPDGTKEKDINLSIAQKLGRLLADKGYAVYLTRDTDESPSPPVYGSKKSADLKARTDMARQVNANLYISIHQNSYSSENVHGAQVFYYSTSSDGKALAECIQAHLISDADPQNTRQAKGNTQYMVLNESPCTAVIVECGFLSNSDECRLLCTEEYQEKLATAICNAVCEWKK